MKTIVIVDQRWTGPEQGTLYPGVEARFFSRIQSAVDAVEGRIYVRPGYYHEDVVGRAGVELWSTREDG